MSDKAKNAAACPDGPFEVDIKIHITDGERTGVVTVCGRIGKFPTADDIKKAIQTAAGTAKEAGMRLMNRHEFIEELLGVGPVAIPGPKEFKP